MSCLLKNNVRISGRPSGRPILFAHGFGCDQNMWRFVAPAFEDDHRVVLFDHVGAGGSDLTAYQPARYASLRGYADDVPERFARMVLIGPSPRYIDDVDDVDDGEYAGGFSREDIEGLLESLDSNYLGWSPSQASWDGGPLFRLARASRFRRRARRASPSRPAGDWPA